MQFHLTQEQVPAEIQWLSELVGMEVQAKVIQETYNGDVMNRVKKVMPI